MARDISLSGGDIAILKTIGFSGGTMKGSILVERSNDMASSELIDTLEGLLMFDYIVSDRERFRTIDDVKKADFKVNPTVAKDLRDAVSGRSKQEPEAKRRRRT